MKIAIAGYNGFIGRRLTEHFPEDQLILLPRRLLYGDVSEISASLGEADLVINLAGSPINRIWTRRNKRIIEESRHGINKRLVEAVNRLKKRPVQFITASAIGIYETSGVHTESVHRMAGNYLASVVKSWEEPLGNLHPEVARVYLRIGVVLGRGGGLLSLMIRLSRWGFLVIMGTGKQKMSFIHMTDLIEAIQWIIAGGKEGVFNLCTPNPADNTTFTRSLAKETGVRMIFRIPEWFIRAGLGGAHIMVTDGPDVRPERLIQDGFIFRFPDIGPALHNLVQKY